MEAHAGTHEPKSYLGQEGNERQEEPHEAQKASGQIRRLREGRKACRQVSKQTSRELSTTTRQGE
eukprot:4911325-Pleurochrysis_carterae.AAC.1